MKKYKPKLPADKIERHIDEYFTYIAGVFHTEQKPVKNAKDSTALEDVIVYDRPPEPPTITGLALYIGFSSRQEFEENEKKPRYAKALKRARLKVEAEYEKKLHLTSAAGAIFALKSLGWNDDRENGTNVPSTLDIRILESGPEPAQNEKEVIL